jgi:hypothetical protein
MSIVLILKSWIHGRCLVLFVQQSCRPSDFQHDAYSCSLLEPNGAVCPAYEYVYMGKYVHSLPLNVAEIVENGAYQEMIRGWSNG